MPMLMRFDALSLEQCPAWHLSCDRMPILVFNMVPGEKTEALLNPALNQPRMTKEATYRIEISTATPRFSGSADPIDLSLR